MTAISDQGFLPSVYRLYDEQLFSYLEDVRGFTRVSKILENLSLRSIASKDKYGNYTFPRIPSQPTFSSLEDAKYFFAERRFVNRFIEETKGTDVFCDVGSYHGFYSLVSSSERCVAFEIDRSNIEVLEENLAWNSKNVDVVRKAVWSKNGSVNIDTGKEGESHVSSSGSSREAVTLNSFFEDREDPDVIKVDVEGAEGHVIQGAEKLLKRSQPVLFVEYHIGERISSFGHSFEELHSLILNLGYSKELRVNRGKELQVVYK